MKQLQQSFINDDGKYSYQFFNCYYFYNPLDPAPWPLPGIVEMVRSDTLTCTCNQAAVMQVHH